MYLVHIFHEKQGLIHFTDQFSSNKNYRKAVINAAEILYTVINNFPSELSSKNVFSIYSLLAKIIRSNTEYSIKNKLFDVLILCLQKLDRFVEDTNVISSYTNLISSLRIAIAQKHADIGK